MTSKEWLNDMHLAFDKHLQIGQQLLAASYFRRHISDTMDFLEIMCKLLESREVESNRDPQGAAALSYAGLEEFASRMELVISATQASRDAVLSLGIPVEGLEQDVALPVEVLVARLDLWEARVLALRRCIQANGKWHRNLEIPLKLLLFLSFRLEAIAIREGRTG